MPNLKDLMIYLGKKTEKYDSLDNLVDQETFTLKDQHPVGSIYWSFDPTDPSLLFGGVWEQIRDRFIYAVGSKVVNTTGGEESHTLTTTEIPAHSHTGGTNYAGDHSHSLTKNIFMAGGSEVLYLNDRNFDGILATDNAANGQWMGSTYISTNGNHAHTVSLNNTGGSGSHNNMPPYICAYCWKRVE